MQLRALILLLLSPVLLRAQPLITPFEQSGGKESATYAECIAFYKALAKSTGKVQLTEAGGTDAGFPLHLVLYAGDRAFDPGRWNRQQKVVILINNGIHPGEPDGIDASMMLLRDAAAGKIRIPDNVVLAVIPVYNIGGALNRGSFSRVNQEGPAAYGFRGSAQNLDLNRDFTKRDSKEAASFAQIFHRLDPNVFVDTHVSDGADYQHTMTLLSSQYDKLGGRLGRYFRDTLDPSLYRRMAAAGWPMIPYVNVEDETPDRGWTAFNDPPRFSSGYASLFQCIAWVPETHMLKPFAQRVRSTYALLEAIIAESSGKAASLIRNRTEDRLALLRQGSFALSWTADTTKHTLWPFKGYEGAFKASEVTGMQRLYYDHSRLVNVDVPIRDYYRPVNEKNAPSAYILPQAWSAVAERLREDGVQLQPLPHDTELLVTAYYIDSFKTLPAPYEKHYRHHHIHATPVRTRLSFRKGDYLIPAGVPARRFLVEMLEPEGEDSYFAWNFFDAVLQRKEGYSDYRWEDVAAAFLKETPGVRAQLEEQKRSDPGFAKDAAAQLRFVYMHSPWYEEEYMRYPVFRVE